VLWLQKANPQRWRIKNKKQIKKQASSTPGKFLSFFIHYFFYWQYTTTPFGDATTRNQHY
jgi:hypothetical protein